MLGWLPTGRVHSLYAQSEVVVVPSIYESYGYPVLDAMAYNAIPLVRHLSGLQEYTSKDEIFSGMSSLSQKLNDIFHNKDLTVIHSENRHRLKTTFSESTVMNQIESVMKEVSK
jgi:glycosyltransferase involved in cell wall biosynthesis